jgi:hypothetical protein
MISNWPSNETLYSPMNQTNLCSKKKKKKMCPLEHFLQTTTPVSVHSMQGAHAPACAQLWCMRRFMPHSASSRYTVFASVICAPAYFAHPNFWGMILDLFLLRVFHAPSYCSFTSHLTACWIYNGIYSAIIMIVMNVTIDKSRLFYKITIKYWQNLPILNYTRIKPRSKPPKKIRIFYAPRFFSGQTRKKCANYASKYGIWSVL